MITPMERLTPALLEAQGQVESRTSENQGIFSDIFHSAIENVRQTDAEKTQTQYLLATGQLDNPAALKIAATKNEIAVSLLVQLRNKALDAYSELTRIGR